MSSAVGVIVRTAGLILKPNIRWIAEAPPPDDPRLALFHPKSHWRCAALNDVIPARGKTPREAYEAWLMLNGRWAQRYA